MASTGYQVSLRVIVFILTFAATTFPVCANHVPCNAAITCRPGKEKLIAQTTVTPSPYDESKNAAYSKFEVEVRNHAAINRLNDEMVTVTSESPRTTSRFSDEDTSETEPATVVTLEAHYQPQDATEMYRLLAEQPAETRSLSAKKKDRSLIQAAKKGRVEEVDALLAAGAAVTARDGNGLTALHWAARKGHVETVRRLLGVGAEVDARDRLQRTPLYYSAAFGHAAVVRVLLASSADPNARNTSGMSPLHVAATFGQAEVAAALLEAGADRWSRDKFGSTPLDLARLLSKHQLVDLLT